MASKEVKTILNVTVNGMTAGEAVKKVRTLMDGVQKSAFNIAVTAFYATGGVIPAYGEHGEASIEDKQKMTRKAFYTAVGRSHSTISRWVGALELIIDAGDFAEYASGLYPFSYDKIFIIYKDGRDALAEYDKADLFSMSVSNLKALAGKADDETQDDGDEKTDGEVLATNNDETQDAGTQDDTTMVIFEYLGKKYTVSKTAMDEFLTKCEII